MEYRKVHIDPALVVIGYQYDVGVPILRGGKVFERRQYPIVFNLQRIRGSLEPVRLSFVRDLEDAIPIFSQQHRFKAVLIRGFPHDDAAELDDESLDLIR